MATVAGPQSRERFRLSLFSGSLTAYETVKPMFIEEYREQRSFVFICLLLLFLMKATSGGWLPSHHY